MKNYKYFLLSVILMFLSISCSNDDEPVDQGPSAPVTPEIIESFDPIDIRFVYEDGSSIGASECIDPEKTYAIEIETSKNSEGNTDVSKIEYTINGASYSMSFSAAGTKRNPIVFVDGRNIAELVKTAKSIEVMFVKQDDFQLVE
ncbi:hypothetical protein [Hyunsoonleella ulvae]|uniref:hypothetical protein n=1 Tax=Hyunsoonleella ulvae TaxID=2799948 RepID=UPI00193981AD|nr:hypothetical protein [Hyunsoonleella ulvae]